MQKDIKELKKLIGFLRKNGISKYKSGDIELELSLVTPKKRPPMTQDENPAGLSQLAFPSWDSLTSEEKMLWSATPIPLEENG